MINRQQILGLITIGVIIGFIISTIIVVNISDNKSIKKIDHLKLEHDKSVEEGKKIDYYEVKVFSKDKLISTSKVSTKPKITDSSIFKRIEFESLEYSRYVTYDGEVIEIVAIYKEDKNN